MHTVRHGCRLDVAVSAAQQPAFARALLEGFGSIAAVLSAVDVRKADGAARGTAKEGDREPENASGASYDDTSFSVTQIIAEANAVLEQREKAPVR